MYIFPYKNVCRKQYPFQVYSRSISFTTKGHLCFCFFLFLGGGCASGAWKFPGQVSNPCHSSDNARYLTCWATREHLFFISFSFFFKSFFLFHFSFFVFLGLHPQHMEVPRLGVQSEPQPQQHQIQAMSVTCAIAHGNAGSLTHWVRPGFKPASSWILVRFVFPVPQQELPPHRPLVSHSYSFFSLSLSPSIHPRQEAPVLHP